MNKPIQQTSIHISESTLDRSLPCVAIMRKLYTASVNYLMRSAVLIREHLLMQLGSLGTPCDDRNHARPNHPQLYVKLPHPRDESESVIGKRKQIQN